ncbi:MAG: hypothetical protein H0X41_11060, partial [Chitinophagaceae bacterium]|nr:hypothetical protein [Chitinophagaceae bacterium]
MDQKNIFIVGTDADNYTIKYMRSRRISVMKYGSPEYLDFIKTIQSDDIVVVHFLDRQKAAVINSIPTTPKILWLSFGAELYASANYHLPLHCSYTKLLETLNPKNNARKIRDAFRMIKYSGVKKDPIQKAISKIDFLATPLDCEFDLLRKN